MLLLLLFLFLDLNWDTRSFHIWNFCCHMRLFQSSISKIKKQTFDNWSWLMRIGIYSINNQTWRLLRLIALKRNVLCGLNDSFIDLSIVSLFIHIEEDWLISTLFWYYLHESCFTNTSVTSNYQNSLIRKIEFLISTWLWVIQQQRFSLKVVRKEVLILLWAKLFLKHEWIPRSKPS